MGKEGMRQEEKEEVPKLIESESEEKQGEKPEDREDSDSEDEDNGLGWEEIMKRLKIDRERNMSEEEKEFEVMKATARWTTKREDEAAWIEAKRRVAETHVGGIRAPPDLVEKGDLQCLGRSGEP